MDMTEHMVYALDIGSSKVALLAANLDENHQICVQEVAVVPNRGMSKGSVIDLEQCAMAVSEAARSLRTVPRPQEVILSVSGQHLQSMNVQGMVQIVPSGRAITSADVLAVIKHSRQVDIAADSEPIMVVPREFSVDGTSGIAKPIGLSASRLEVVTHLVLGNVAHLMNLEKVVQLAGLEVQQMVAEPVAAGLGLLRPEELEIGTAVINIGAQTTAVAIYSRGTIAYSAVIPVGSSSVTNDLVSLLKMTPEDAEQLKRKHGRALAPSKPDESTVEVRQIGQTQSRHMQRRVLFEIIESRMREIAKFAAQHIEKSGHKGLLPGGTYVTGGGALLPGTPQLFAQVMGDANVKLAAPRVEGPASIKASGAEWSTAVGMAAFALLEGDEEVVPASGMGSWKERIRTFFQMKV